VFADRSVYVDLQLDIAMIFRGELKLKVPETVLTVTMVGCRLE